MFSIDEKPVEIGRRRDFGAMAVPCVSQQPIVWRPSLRDFLNSFTGAAMPHSPRKTFAETRPFKIDPHAAEITIIGEEAVTMAGFDRTDEASRQHHVAGAEPVTIAGKPMHKPDHAQHRIIENACAEAGLLDLVIARDNRANPSQIDIIDAVLRIAKNNPGIGRIVRDGVENNPLRTSFRIGAVNARTRISSAGAT